jgi:hypothetical protein
MSLLDLQGMAYRNVNSTEGDRSTVSSTSTHECNSAYSVGVLSTCYAGLGI